MIAGLCCAKWSSGCRGKPSLFHPPRAKGEAHSIPCLFFFNNVGQADREGNCARQ